VASSPVFDATVSRSAGPFTLTLRRYDAGSLQPPHTHESAQITILLAGAIREVVEGREEIGTPLSVVVKPPDVRHSDEIGRDGARTLQITFPGSFAAKLGREGHALGRWRWLHAGLPGRTMLHLLSHVRSEAFDPGEGEDGAWEVLGSISAERAVDGGSPSDVLRRIKERIDAGAGASVSALAGEAGMHPASLTRAFQRCFGISVVSYRSRRRFRRAAAAIAAGGLDLARVAYDQGYSDQAHLCRDFRRRAGVTPSEYRRLVRGL
jgi:AraC family transcriptional regulator